MFHDPLLMGNVFLGVLIMTRSVKTRALAAFSILGTFLLAGCGDVGAGSHPLPSNAGSVSGDAAQSTTERYVAQSGLDIVRVSSLQATASLPTSTLSVARKVESLRRSAASTQATCTNGETESLSVSGTVLSFDINTYYDSGCADLWQAVVGTLNTSQDSFSATVTTDSLAGSVIDYETLNGTLTLTSIAVQGTDADSVGGTPVMSIGLTCSLSGSLACGAADASNVSSLNEAIGVSGKFTYASSSSNGSTTMTGTGAENVYTGSLGGLSIAQGSQLSWTVSGGTLVASLTENLSETVNGSNTATAFTVTGSDVALDTGLSMSLNNSGGFNGTITQLSTGTTVATFTVDQNGNGTITFAGGLERTP
jgi:hypothetical protein